MNDDRISRYLADQAEAISLPPADATDVMRRGTRRRMRRRAGLVGAVAVVGVLATTVAVRDHDDQDVTAQLANPGVVPSTFDWSLVQPTSGLGYSNATARLADGSVYGLSTAPGPTTDKTAAEPPHLYRSDDGAEWVHADLPDGISASALAGSGDTLYALGTAPGGGGVRDVVVQASDDGAHTWRSLELPSEVAELQARHPGQVSLGTPELAAKDASHVVATIAASTNLDLAKYRPDLVTGDTTYQWTDTGVEISTLPPPCAGFEDGANVSPTKDEITACRETKGRAGTVLGTYTWDQLGIDAELQSLVGGRTYAYASDDGTTFASVDLPAEGRDGWASRILATADGYDMVVSSRMVKGTSSTTSILRSTDGHSWAVADQIAGSPMDAGLLGDRLAVALYTDSGSNVVKVQQTDGSWLDLDLAGAVPAPADVQVAEDGRTVNKPQQAWIGALDFGPLGLAATVSTTDANGRGIDYVVHSKDGTSLDVLEVADAAPHAGSVIGLSVTADAIVVRLNDGVASNGQPPKQVVLVGTPRG